MGRLKAPGPGVIDHRVQRQGAMHAETGTEVASLISTHKALGGGWELRDGMDIVPEETKDEMRERTNWGKLLANRD